MNIYYMDKKYQVDNDQNEIKFLLESIRENIKDMGYVISHYIIDGIEVYEPHEDWLRDNITQISNIEVIPKSETQLFIEILKDAHAYLVGAVPKLEELINSFYKSPLKEDWELLCDYIDAIKWMIELVKINEHVQLLPPDITTVIDSIINEIPNLLHALEEQDAVLIADILSYENLPNLNELELQLKQFLTDNDKLNDTRGI